MKKIVVLLIFTFWVGVLSAQDYAFKVIAFKGSVKVDGQGLKVGSTLSSNQTVTLGEGAYLALVHNSGKTHELNKAGAYSAKDMEAVVAKNNQGNIYMAMVVNELTGNSAEVNRKPKTGAVERSLGKDALVFQADKKLLFYHGRPIAISWFAKDQAIEKALESDQFRVSLLNMFATEIGSQITKNNYAILDLSNIKFDAENTGIVYKVTSLKNPTKFFSVQYSLEPVDAETCKMIENELASGTYNDTPLGNLILANFFEENGLNPNAQAAYLRAIELSSSDDDPSSSEVFKKQYEAFLDRNKYSKSHKIK